MAPQILILFIATFFIELLFYRIVLSNQYKNALKKFDKNKSIIINLNLKNYELGSGHLYE